MNASKLSELDIKKRIRKIKEWSYVEGKLVGDFEFKDFSQALRFVNRVGEIAEQLNHHPDILIHSWNQVKATIYTHSVGGLTEKDFELAEKIDGLL